MKKFSVEKRMFPQSIRSAIERTWARYPAEWNRSFFHGKFLQKLKIVFQYIRFFREVTFDIQVQFFYVYWSIKCVCTYVYKGRVVTSLRSSKSKWVYREKNRCSTMGQPSYMFTRRKMNVQLWDSRLRCSIGKSRCSHGEKWILRSRYSNRRYSSIISRYSHAILKFFFNI